MGFEIKLSDNYKAADSKRIGGFIVNRNWKECGDEQVKVAESFDPKGTVFLTRETGNTAEVELPEFIPVIEPEIELPILEMPSIATIEPEIEPAKIPSVVKHSKPQKKKRK